MPSDWPRSRLEDVAASQQGSIAIGPFGSRLKTGAYTKQGVALIRGTNLAGSKFFTGEFVYVSEETARGLGNANVKPWDLVFPHRGNIGAVGLVPEGTQRYALSTSLMKVTLDRRLADPLFMYYFFRSPLGQAELLKNASQVGTPGIATPLTSLRACVVPTPPIEEQVHAAQVLSSLDDRIDLLRQTNSTLEFIAQALFKSWFIDFDPVRAKAEGREPEGMDTATAALFPAEFEESALGMIPKGWTACAVSELASLKGGKQLERSAFDDAGPNPIFGGAGEMGRTHLSNADGFVLTVGRVGAYCGQFFWHEGAAWVNNNASLVRVHSPRDSYWLHQSLLTSDIDRIKKGAAQPFVSNSDIEALPLVLASVEAREAFYEIAKPLYERQSITTAQAGSLRALRDSLLPRLISGNLRLPEAQEQMEDALA